MNTKIVIGISAGLLGSTLILFGIAARMAEVRIADLTTERDIYASRAANEANRAADMEYNYSAMKLAYDKLKAAGADVKLTLGAETFDHMTGQVNWMYRINVLKAYK